MDSFTFYINCFLSMGIFLVIIYIVYKSFSKENKYIIESFNQYMPYDNSEYTNKKMLDEKLLRITRTFWENSNEGYYNANTGGIPLVPITLFEPMKRTL